MKKTILKGFGALALFAFSASLFTSCTENIDDSDLYTFTGEMMTDHFKNNPDVFSDYYTLLQRVRPSKRSESTMAQLLEARGHYTCFAPTNEAIEFYIDSVKNLGMTETTDLTQIPDSIAEPIVFNTIIDNQSAEAYASTDFSVGALSMTNMNDRYINISYGNDSVSGSTVIYVNTNSQIIQKDIEVENGYIHKINKVLSPSTATIGELIEVTANTQYFGHLLKITKWDAALQLYKDAEYEDRDEILVEPKRSASNGGHWEGIYPEHRYFGFTVFTELDSVFKQKLGGFESHQEFLTKLTAYIKENANYGDDTSYGTDYDNPNNAINQFVAYHILPERLIWSRMVIFSNEKGFCNTSPNDGSSFSTNVWEYYETMDAHRRSMKITGIRNGKRINRHSTYNLSTYKEKEVDIPGINIHPTNGSYDNNAMNGYYYPIDDILLWTDKVQKKVLNERQRYDICSLLPELMTNNMRRTGDSQHRAWYFLGDYFETQNGGSGCMLNVSDETDLCYLTNTMNAHSGGWLNYQADEFNISGTYDFVMKLPPVPNTGTYEIRYGMNNNSVRGMAQIYLGTNPNNLPAVGIPIDLRTGASDNSASIGWSSDADLGNDDAIEENEKMLRNNDYMKGPKYFYPSSTQSGREFPLCLRRIIYRGQLEEGKTYYIRFKSVLESSSTEFFYDYLEFVPKTVYNGDEAEDKW